MSVYKPKNSPHFHYDFVVKKRRYYGSTGVSSLRAAERFEERERRKVAEGAFETVAAMTFDTAAGRYWSEVGRSRGDAVDVERRISVLLELLGRERTLGEINQRVVASAIERRRNATFRRTDAPGAREYPLSNSTVNRDVIETLRPILKRARTHWTDDRSVHGLPEIDWRSLRLREPRALSRLYSVAERQAWLAACEGDCRLALDLLLTNGLRFGELFFPLEAFDGDLEKPSLTLQKGRKRDVILHVPLRLDHARELGERIRRAQVAGLRHVWFHQKGQELRPLTYSMLEYRLDKAARAAGIGGGRRIHGARHHAGSTILQRSKGNLKAVQTMLGHASISSSQRYAHVLADELRGLIEDGEDSRNSPVP